MTIEVTEHGDGSNEVVDADKQFVVTVYDYNNPCQDILHDTFDEYGFTVGDDTDFEVVDENPPDSGCFRTNPREMTPGTARSLFDDLVMNLAADLPGKRVVTDEFRRSGGDPLVYSISLV